MLNNKKTVKFKTWYGETIEIAKELRNIRRLLAIRIAVSSKNMITGIWDIEKADKEFVNEMSQPLKKLKESVENV